MSLQSAGPSSIPNNAKININQPRATNSIADILGARPAQKMNKFTNKPNSYDVSDIYGTRPLALHRETNSVDYTLKHDDIDGARPRGCYIKNGRSSNPVDPLVPNYKLPSYKLEEEAPSKFLRDTLDVTDIDGTRSRPLYKFPPRENFDVTDIQGAKAGWKPRHKRVQREGPARDIMAVADINMQGVKKSGRCTDPLRPVHFINGMEVADDMVHTKPKLLPPARDGPFYPLNVRDIEGAYPGWQPPHKMQPPLEARRHFRNTNFVGDIAGAQSDTVKHSIKTNRVTNPLNPCYISLDGDAIDSTQPVSEATLAAQASLRYAMDNSARQEAEESRRMAEMNGSMNNTAELRDINFERPPQNPSSNQRQDERDQMIRQLQAEVRELRNSQPMSNSRPPSFRQASPGAVTQFRQSSPALSNSGSNNRNSRQPTPSGSLYGGSNRNSRQATPTESVMSARSARSGASVDRMVLRSSDGNPRVKMTPREQRAAKAYEADVAAVRDL